MPKSGSQPGFSKVDDLADSYVARADDESLSKKEREASMLFSMAETNFEAENYEEATKAANQALETFRSIGNREGYADSLRVIIHGLRQEYEALQFSVEGKREADKVLEKAEKRAKDEMKAAQVAGDGRTEAAMNLSLAEVLIDRRKMKLYNEAFEHASKARLYFSKVGSKKLEGIAYCAMCQIHFNKGSAEDTMGTATEALACFQECNDRFHEAKSMHFVALAYHKFYQFHEAMAAAEASLELLQHIGNRKLEAYELNQMAVWLTYRGKPDEAVPFAKRAYEILFEHEYGKGWQAAALKTLVHALLQSGSAAQALRYAKDAIYYFESLNDHRSKIFAMESCVQAYYSMDSLEDAVDMAMQLISVCKEIHDVEWEATSHQVLCMVYKKMGDMHEAEIAAEEAVKVLQSQPRPDDMAIALENLGEFYQSTKKVAEGIDCYEKALDIWQRMEMRGHEGLILLKLASGYWCAHKKGQAMEAALDAVQIFKEEGEMGGLASAYQLLSNFAMNDGKVAEAIEYAEERCTAATQLYDKNQQAEALKHLAALSLAVDNPRRSQRYALEAQKLLRAEGDRIAELGSLCSFIEATAHLICGPDMEDVGMSSESVEFLPNVKKALKFGKEAESIAKASGSKHLLAQASYFKAISHFLNASYGESLQGTSTSIKIYRKLGDQAGEGRAALLQARVFKKTGQSSKASESASVALKVAQSSGDPHLEAVAEDFLKSMEIRGRQYAYQLQVDSPMGNGPVDIAVSRGEQATAVSTKGQLEPMAVKSRIMDIISHTIGSEDIAADQPLMESGMDSLSSVQFRNDLAKDFQVQLPAALIFDYPTLAALADFIINKVNDDY